MTAVLIGAFMIQSFRPAPRLYAEEPVLVHAIILGFVLANILNYTVALFGDKVFARLVPIKRSLLLRVILLLFILSSFGIRNVVFDVFAMLAFGVIGYVSQKRDFRVGPIVLALILEPTIERSFRRALVINNSDPSMFLTRRISLIFLIITVVSIIPSHVVLRRSMNRNK